MIKIDLFAWFGLLAIDIDRATFDGFILLAAVFHNCVLHFQFLQPSLHRTICERDNGSGAALRRGVGKLGVTKFYPSVLCRGRNIIANMCFTVNSILKPVF